MRANSNLSTQKVTLATLARLAVTQCTPVFQQVNSEIGVGLYHDRVYVDVRNTYKFWNPSGTFSPQVRSAAEFKIYMQRLFEAAVGEGVCVCLFWPGFDWLVFFSFLLLLLVCFRGFLVVVFCVVCLLVFVVVVVVVLLAC